MSAAGKPHIAVVGGGWAGCAAAVTLAQAGVRVTLIEQAQTLGGRARRLALDGMALDNGQHLLAGAYRQTQDLIGRVHGAHRASALFHRLPLALRPFGAPRADAVALTAWRAPAPLHLVLGILAARGLSWRERGALIAGFRRLSRAGFRAPRTQTVAQCFAGTPLHAMGAVWEPLCIAALNTPPESASAQSFAHVLRAAFTGSARNADFLVPAIDLSALFPDAAGRYVSRHGGAVRTGVTVRAIVRHSGGVAVSVGTGTEAFDGVVVAVGPHQLAAALGPDAAATDAWRAPLAQVAAFAWESITTAYLGYMEPVPLPVPLMRLDDAPGQWIFDRSAALGTAAPEGARGLVAVVISTNGPHDALDQATLAAQADAQLRRLAGRWPLPVWSRVIAERRATYACTPGLARPASGRIAPRLYLAGDYTDAEFPATLEAATRTGVAAARALLRDARALLARG
jgi:squalene-associated FAD-dependent desaturase